VKDFLQKDKTFWKVFAKTEFWILRKLKEKITHLQQHSKCIHGTTKAAGEIHELN
jgi:hypothetical protein